MRNDAKPTRMNLRSERAGNARGFTLLEVTIAVAIAGLGLIALFQAGSTGLLAADAAARVDEAVERARSHLAAFAGADAIVPGDSEGDDGGGYHWRLIARPLATQILSQSDQSAPQTTLYAVEAVISWHAGGRTRSVVLETRRLGASVSSQ